jgi:hypothetical protein
MAKQIPADSCRSTVTGKFGGDTGEQFHPFSLERIKGLWHFPLRPAKFTL